MPERSVLRSGLPADTWSPRFRVLLDGRNITEQRNQPAGKDTIRYGDVLDLSVTLDLHNPGSFSITLNNWDREMLDFIYSEQFELGQPLSIDFGYAEELVRVFNGKISSIAPSFPDGGAPTVVIRGVDTMRDLANKKPANGEKIRFPNATDVEVARQVADRLEVRHVIDDQPGLPRELIVIKGQSYAEFLVERANRIEFETYFAVDQDSEKGEDTLYFVRRKDGRDSRPFEAFALVWGLGQGDRPTPSGTTGAEYELAPNLISFSTSISDADQVETLEVRGWDPRNKTHVSEKATDKDLDQASSKRRTERIAKPGTSHVEYSMSVASKEEAKRLAIALLRERRKGFAKGSGKVVGLPRMQPGKMVELFGLGPRFSGDYFVTKVDHSFSSSGFLTSFEVDRSRLRAKG